MLEELYAMCEAEYVALFDASKEALFMRAMLVFLHPQLIGVKTDVFGDGEGAKAMAQNPRSASKKKHINVKLYFIREMICAGEIYVLHVETTEQHTLSMSSIAVQNNP